MRSVMLLAGFTTFISVHTLHAGVILNPTNGTTYQLNFYEQVGNSFVAEDSSVIAALYIRPFVTSDSPLNPIRFQLFSGLGTAGALLFDHSFVPASSFEGFFDVDLSSIPLTIGNTYSFTASISGTSAFWGIVGSGGAYGTRISYGVPVAGRLALRITPTTVSAVPEPSSLTLLSLGALSLAAARRRRQVV